jgi:hypothetical protein
VADRSIKRIPKRYGSSALDDRMDAMRDAYPTTVACGLCPRFRYTGPFAKAQHRWREHTLTAGHVKARALMKAEGGARQPTPSKGGSGEKDSASASMSASAVPELRKPRAPIVVVEECGRAH